MSQRGQPEDELAALGEARTAVPRRRLTDVVSQESRRLAALEQIQSLLDRPAVHLGGPCPSRDELQER